MKRVLATATITALLISVIPNSYAAITAGSTCAKVGATSTYAGKKYTCIKSGKKLVWNKGVKVSTLKPVATPTPTPTPTPVPTPTPSNPGLSGPLAQRAYDEISKQLDSQPAVTLQISVDQSPNALTRLLDPTLQTLKDGLRFWQQATPRGSSVKVVFASNNDWAWFIRKMTDLQPTNAAWLAPLQIRSQTCPLCQYAGYNGGTVEGDQLFWFMPTPQTDPTNYAWAGAGPHEWTHFAQQSLTGNINLIPCWLKEGQATYYGNAIAMRNQAEWVSAWRSGIRTLDQDGLPDYRTLDQAQILQWFNTHDESIPATSCGPGGAFFMGAMASEYLLGTLGHQGMVDLLVDIGRTRNWRLSLSKSLGVSISTAMAQIASFVATERDWAIKDG